MKKLTDMHNERMGLMNRFLNVFEKSLQKDILLAFNELEFVICSLLVRFPFMCVLLDICQNTGANSSSVLHTRKNTIVLYILICISCITFSVKFLYIKQYITNYS